MRPVKHILRATAAAVGRALCWSECTRAFRQLKSYYPESQRISKDFLWIDLFRFGFVSVPPEDLPTAVSE